MWEAACEETGLNSGDHQCEPADTQARLAARVNRLFLPGSGDEEAGPNEHAEGVWAALELHDLSSR